MICHWIGGTGGGAVAGRLAENSKWNVLVIEAGPSCVPFKALDQKMN